ncbi:mevalonate kinase family protein [Dyadobacter jiangsuensis]|uniref:Glucuronokinase n=1 Tax=Dyadobacter jiangsuensis TaxID=1591085 RepID=A0A2P8FTW6_9BACT|nr:GHMP kinase [Dyadobacter jiangsuensis]PSL25158.1 glucuronokinase [Dyadobacter jiangsuensis]
MIIETRAYARAGLLGNPSDGFFGKTISISVRNFGASISLYESPELHIEPQPQDLNTFRSIFHLRDSVNMLGYNGGIPLIKAGIKKFGDYCEENNIKLPNKNFTVRYRSSIPRQVGMSGSSAIIVALFRALMQFYKVEIPIEILPQLVMVTETEELGITAGLQDRVIQCYEGCVYMDFDKTMIQTQGHGRYERINPELLPKLYVAYNTNLSKVSGKVHNDVRARYDRGEQDVIDVLGQIAQKAEDGRTALLEGRSDDLHSLMNENFDLRCKIYNVPESNKKLINAARACGASAKFAGSGGTIIGIYKDDDMLNQLFVQLKKFNARVIRPFVV